MDAVPKSRYAIFFAIAAAALVLDLVSKTWMFSHLGMPNPEGPKIVLVPGWLTLETVLNEGALFGQGQGMGALFIALSIVALGGIGYWLFMRRAARDLLLTVFLGAISAGILGNLYDRLGLPGLNWHVPYRGHQVGEKVYAVRDFIHFQCPWFDWPVFNIADCLLVCGVAALAWHAYLWEPRRAKKLAKAALPVKDKAGQEPRAVKSARPSVSR